MKVTKADVAEYIGLINLEFNQTPDDVKLRQRTAMWYAVLKDFEKPVVDEAFYRVMQTCEYPPRISNICNEIRRMETATEKTVPQLWSELESTLPDVERSVGQMLYIGEEERERLRAEIDGLYESLDEEIRLYVRSRQELVTLACAEDKSFEKGRFLREMPALRQVNKIQKSMSPELLRLVSDAADGRKMITDGGERK